MVDSGRVDNEMEFIWPRPSDWLSQNPSLSLSPPLRFLVQLKEVLIRQLGCILTLIGLHTKEFAGDITDMLLAHWWLAAPVQHACIGLLSSMVSVLNVEFRPHLTRLMPAILRTFEQQLSDANLILVSGGNAASFFAFFRLALKTKTVNPITLFIKKR